MLVNFWNTFFGWMPPLLTVIILAFVAISIIVIVFKIVAFIMDVLPFV